MGQHVFSLSFSRIRCQRCQAPRIRGIRCPDCGKDPEPWEVDPEAGRRRTAAEELLRELRDAPLPQPMYTDEDGPLAVVRMMATWMDEFWAAMHGATESQFREFVALRESVRAAIGLKIAFSSHVPRRPFGRPTEIAKQMTATCSQMVEHYLLALAAQTPTDAGTEAAAAQGKLDDLATQARLLNEWLARHERVSDAPTVQEALLAIIMGALEDAGTTSLLGLAGAAPGAAFAGIDTRLDAGTAVNFTLTRAFAELFLSVPDFDRKVEKSYLILSADSSAIPSLLTDESFQSDLSRLTLELYDSAIAAQRSVSEAGHLRMTARAVLELHSTLVEAAGPLLATPLLLALGEKQAPYASLRTKDATDHLRKAQANEKISGLLSGLDGHLRTAQAHRAVSYNDEILVTDLRSGSKEYRYEDLVESTFEALESVLAGFAAIRLAAASAGVELAEDAGPEALGLTVIEITELFFRMFGYPDAKAVQGESGKLQIDLGTPSVLGVSSTVGALSTAIATATRVRLQPSDGDAWECDISAYARFRTLDDEFLKQVELIRIQAAWTNDHGEAWLSTEVLKKWVAITIAAGTELPPHDKFHRFRTLKGLVAELGVVEVEQVIREATRAARMQLIGEPADQRCITVRDTIIDWGMRSIDLELI